MLSAKFPPRCVHGSTVTLTGHRLRDLQKSYPVNLRQVPECIDQFLLIGRQGRHVQRTRIGVVDIPDEIGRRGAEFTGDSRYRPA